MRYALPFALVMLAAPVDAWTFASSPLCTIWHDTGSAEMRVTYDPRRADAYSITVTLADGRWAQAPFYAIRFDGVRGFTISTDRHRLSDDNRVVVAEDSGFGNVLRGLAGGGFATARLGNISYVVPLAGADEAVAKFEACAQPAGIS